MPLCCAPQATICIGVIQNSVIQLFKKRKSYDVTNLWCEELAVHAFEK